MSSRKIFLFTSISVVFNILITPTNGSLLDWIWPNRNVQNFRTDIEHSDSSLPVIPFEFSENNDRFIMDMSKVLGIRLSDLDFCQQRVILSLKSSCNTLTDEELGKLAIALMNCQHLVEKRVIIDCSAKVPLADCVLQMSEDAKTSYGQILGRTKSVCLAIRQDQFRGMTELTINKLILQVERLRASQNQLEMATLNSVDEMSENQLKLLEKQNELLKLASAQKISAEENLKEILREKATLRSGGADLNLFIGKLKTKIVEGLSELNEQNTETKQIFKDLFDDLVHINEISTRISNRLLEADRLANDHTEKTNENFESILENLKHVNKIVQNFSDKIDSFREDFISKLKWMEPILGSEDDFSYRCSILIIHLLYLLLGMICLVFVNATTGSRFLLLGIVLISFLCTLQGIIDLNLILLLEALITLLIINFFNKINNDYDLLKKIWNLFKFDDNLEINQKEIRIPVHTENNGYKNSIITESNNNNNEYEDEREEIIVNRAGCHLSFGQNKPNFRIMSEEFEKNSSRNSTPIYSTEFSQNNFGRCKALTRNGVRCQLSTPSSYIDFCRIHERSSRER